MGRGRLTGPDGMPPADVLAVAERLGPPAEPRHPALSAALALMPDALAAGGPVRITELAPRTGVSAGRLGHLFGEQLGLPFPAWVRWARLRAAIPALADRLTLAELWPARRPASRRARRAARARTARRPRSGRRPEAPARSAAAARRRPAPAGRQGSPE
ncbi:helix-turn-helix domain-containing protein [Streptomyces erythrochromogenes]|uniref:hypothetical protein n=1 Tax=Streptomyces erythrochromogenes TaxID=285574 RepID=UPI0038026D8A